MRVLALGHEGPTRVKSRLRAAGQSIARIDTGGPGHPVGDLTPDAAAAIAAADVVLVSCYGGGTTAQGRSWDRSTATADGSAGYGAATIRSSGTGE